MKATLLKYCEMTREALTQLKSWLQRFPNGFDVENFHNPTLKIAQSTNAVGQVVCYCAVEPAYVITSLATNPQATEIEVRTAGDYIEGSIAREAQLTGATKLLLVVPDTLPSQPDEKWIRIVERKIIPRTLAMQGIGDDQSTSVMKLMN